MSNNTVKGTIINLLVITALTVVFVALDVAVIASPPHTLMDIVSGVVLIWLLWAYWGCVKSGLKLIETHIEIHKLDAKQELLNELKANAEKAEAK